MSQLSMSQLSMSQLTINNQMYKDNINKRKHVNILNTVNISFPIRQNTNDESAPLTDWANEIERVLNPIEWRSP